MVKKDAKKRKKEKRKKNKLKQKSGQALLLEKIRKSKGFPNKRIIVEPKGAERMSEVILHFAEPFLEECKDEETEKKVIGLAILIWNVSLLPKEKQDQSIQKICSGTSPSNDADGFATALHYVNMLLERKKKYFPDNKRAIRNYQISGFGKNRRLDVASMLSS